MKRLIIHGEQEVSQSRIVLGKNGEDYVRDVGLSYGIF